MCDVQIKFKCSTQILPISGKLQNLVISLLCGCVAKLYFHFEKVNLNVEL
jgi:hypothetical protein